MALSTARWHILGITKITSSFASAMVKILCLCLVLLSWTLQPVFLKGLSPMRQRRQSRVPRQVRQSEFKRKEQERRRQGQHKPRKSITTIGDGLHYMHQASLKGDFAKAAEWFEKLCALSDFQVEANTINTVIQAAANVGNVKEAKSWFQKLSEYDLNATQESYTSMISAAAKRRMVPEAEKYFQEMKAQEIEPDDVAYGALLSAFARVGDLERAEKYFNMMERGSGDLKPNQIVLGTMVTAAANSKQGYQAAQKWLQRMEDAEFKPGKRQYTDLINAASKAGDLQAAEEALQKMGAAYVMPDAITYTAIMNAAARVQGPELATSYFKDMKLLNLEPTVVTYGTLLRAWFKAKKYENAIATFQEMQSAGFDGNVLDYTQVFISLSRLNRFWDIEHILADMSARNVKTDAQCRMALQDAFGKEEYARIAQKFRLDRHGDGSFDKIGSRIERTQEAKLANMRRDQTKAALRRSNP